jgi:hypothetical protein
MPRPLTDGEQFAALCVLDCLSDLVTVSESETFSKTEVLLFIDMIRSEHQLFDPDVVIAQQETTQGM